MSRVFFCLFLSLYRACYNIASILCFVFYVARHVGFLFPNQGLNMQPFIERQSLSHCTASEVSESAVFIYFLTDHLHLMERKNYSLKDSFSRI